MYTFSLSLRVSLSVSLSLSQAHVCALSLYLLDFPEDPDEVFAGQLHKVFIGVATFHQLGKQGWVGGHVLKAHWQAGQRQNKREPLSKRQRSVLIG